MPTPIFYRATVQKLASLAGHSSPAHVSVAAAGALARLLSPANPQRRTIQQMLQAADAFELARHKLRDLHDRDDHAATITEPGPVSASPIEEEELTEEDDDPL